MMTLALLVGSRSHAKPELISWAVIPTQCPSVSVGQSFPRNARAYRLGSRSHAMPELIGWAVVPTECPSLSVDLPLLTRVWRNSFETGQGASQGRDLWLVQTRRRSVRDGLPFHDNGLHAQVQEAVPSGKGRMFAWESSPWPCLWWKHTDGRCEQPCDNDLWSHQGE